MRYIVIFLMILISAVAFAENAVEAAASCIVMHQTSDAQEKATTTCFENIGLERTSFESGVCQWKTDAQATANVQTTTRFVPYCPVSYIAYCDRLVLGPQVIVPVKIFIYDESADVLGRAKKQCLSGGGKWNINGSETE